jgi:abortive infection Abi-like protein
LTHTGPIFDVLTSFRSQRYKASQTSLRKAYDFLSRENPDYPNAAKEAIAALESIARLITGAGTLGKAVERMKQHGKIDTPTANVLEAIYVYRNRTPGVGHGGATPPSTEVAEARLIVNLCASASLFLLELDG